MALQYLRWLPAQLGLVNKGAFNLELKRLYPDDIFLVAYPKSGSTWLSFIVAYMKAGTNKIISFDELETIVPVVYGNQDMIDRRHHNRIIKSHHPLFNYYPRMVYIYRDYRDVLVSFYHYQLKLQFFSGTFSEFIRSGKHLEFHGSWKTHVNGALRYKELRAADCVLIKYETLNDNFEAIAHTLAAFCHFDETRIDFARLKELTSFKSMKSIEADLGSDFMKRTNTHFVRAGKSGSWQEVFSKEDLEYLYADKDLVLLMQSLGYEC